MSRYILQARCMPGAASSDSTLPSDCVDLLGEDRRGKFPMSNRGFRNAFAVAAGLSALALGFSVQAQPQATIAHGSSVSIPPGATVTISGNSARLYNNAGLGIGGGYSCTCTRGGGACSLLQTPHSLVC